MEISKQNIMVVDAEAFIRHVLATRLTILGYRVFLAPNVIDALNVFKKEQLDLIVLDVTPLKLDGYKLCRTIRENSKVPIIFLTALGSISDRVNGFELGADDYLVKPFSPKELEARIRSILGRGKSENNIKKSIGVLYTGNLTIDLHNSLVLKNNIHLNLTEIEFRLFEFLINNSGKSLARRAILEHVWGYTPERDIDTRIVDVHIFRLRSKIEDNPRKPYFILTIRGIGYMFQKN